MIDQTFIHYGSLASVIAFTSFGASIGSARASKAALEAINIAPTAKTEINKIIIVGLALIETASILGLIAILLVLFANPQTIITLPMALCHLGIALSLGIAGCMSGIASAYPVQAACYSIARQPFFGQQLLNLMVITQTIIQTPLIFAFIIALILSFAANPLMSLNQGLVLLATGLCIGLGSIGPSLGLGSFAADACKAVGINRKSYNVILPFSLISGAFIETPLIFAFIISLILLTVQNSVDNLIGIKALAAAFCMGIGTYMPGIASSKTARAACNQIGSDPTNYSLLSQLSMFGQGIIDAAAVYALLISLFIVFVK